MDQIFFARAFGAREYLLFLCTGTRAQNHLFVSISFWRVFKDCLVRTFNQLRKADFFRKTHVKCRKFALLAPSALATIFPRVRSAQNHVLLIACFWSVSKDCWARALFAKTAPQNLGIFAYSPHKWSQIFSLTPLALAK